MTVNQIFDVVLLLLSYFLTYKFGYSKGYGDAIEEHIENLEHQEQELEQVHEGQNGD